MIRGHHARGLRLLAALAILVGGAVHLQQWLTVFRDQSIGPLFLANAAASLVVAIALVATDDPVVRWAALAGVVVSVGSLAALLASRTVGLPGFTATGYDVAEVEAIVAEVAATAALAAWFVVSRGRAPAPDALAASSQRPLGAA